MLLHHTKKLLHSKADLTKWKDSLVNGRKLFANHIFKGLIFKTYKELINSGAKQQCDFKNGQKIWIDILPKKTSWWPIGTRDDAQHHYSSGNCKSEPQWALTSHLSEKLFSKKIKNKKCLLRMWRKGNLCPLLVGIWIDAATMKNSVEFPQKIKNRTIIWYLSSPSRYLSERNRDINLKKITSTPMSIAALFIRAKIRKLPKCWMNG